MSLDRKSWTAARTGVEVDGAKQPPALALRFGMTCFVHLLNVAGQVVLAFASATVTCALPVDTKSCPVAAFVVDLYHRHRHLTSTVLQLVGWMERSHGAHPAAVMSEALDLLHRFLQPAFVEGPVTTGDTPSGSTAGMVEAVVA